MSCRRRLQVKQKYKSVCLTKNRGGFFDDQYLPHGECIYPYEGNLCNQCADEHAKFGCKFALF